MSSVFELARSISLQAIDAGKLDDIFLNATGMCACRWLHAHNNNTRASTIKSSYGSIGSTEQIYIIMVFSTAVIGETRTISGIPSARNNNLVAESDYYAAIAALQKKIKEKQSSTFVNDDDLTRTDSSNLQNRQQLYTDLSNSLCKQIQKIVQPISDEAFHTYLSQYNDSYITRLSAKENTGIQSGSQDDVGISSSSKVALEEVSFSDEELRDHVAMKRVQELRQQVREKVHGLQELRQSTLQRAISITERQAAVLAWRSQIRHSKDVMKNDDHPIMTTDQLLEQHQNALLQMKESFMNLYESIHNKNENYSASSLKNEYQKTIHVIEQGLLQQPSVSTNHLSQIEQAIYRRDYCSMNDIDEQQDVEMNDQASLHHSNDEEEKEPNDDPEQTLFHLLCR